MSLRIPLWGPRSSGKTTYLTMVYGASLLSDIKWTIRPNSIESMEFVRSNLNSIMQGRFPSATVPYPEIPYYSFEFWPGTPSKKDNSFANALAKLLSFLREDKLLNHNQGKYVNTENHQNHSVVIDFADIAGEQYLNEPLDHPLWEHLASGDGLICLLDPNDMNDHFEITLNLLQFLWLKLKSRSHLLIDGKLPHYIAFCFSKIDQYRYFQYNDNPEALLELMETTTGINIHRMLQQYFLPERLKYFALSSIGRVEVREDDFDGGKIIDPRSIAPINVLEPLRWLFTITGV